MTRMRKLSLLFLICSLPAISAAPEDMTRYVNIFIGTGGDGHTTPAATVPFGMVQLGPDTYNHGWKWCSGYRYPDSSIMGFSHTHLSGTGVGDMLDVLVMPGTGAVHTSPGAPDKPGEGYRSRFSHKDEVAQPGYYSVLLSDYGIKAELSATEHAGIHKYTLPKSDSAHFIVDLAHVMWNTPDDPNDKAAAADSHILDSHLSIVGNDTVEGERRTSIWATDRHMYFVMKFSRPFLSAQMVSGDQILDAAAREVSGKASKCLLHYKTSEGETIYVKTGISGVSIEGARKNLDAEIPGWDFAKVQRDAHAAWERELSRVQVRDSSQKNKEIFYTGLYHTMLAPTLFDDVDGQYRGMDGQVHQLRAGAHNYGTFSLWDTFRATHPLYTLTQAQRVPDFINTLIRMSEESSAGMPVWPLAGSETGCMTGYHSAAVIAEACVKHVKGVDFSKAYPAMRKRALVDDYRGLGLDRQLGYIPCDKEPESATKTMEYAYDAWAVAQVARSLGKMDDYKLLLTQAGNYRNLFDKSTGFIRPRLEDGHWAAPFDPKTTGTSKKWRDFTESNSWQGTWAAQHDVRGTIDLMGGREAFVQKLDALFNQSKEINGEVPVDMAGLVGMYAHGNEPSHHIAYLYDYAGAPYKTQARVRSLMDTMYDNQPDGLAGNEDCGQMSAWYVISALGFYAVDPASGNYVLGSPLFDQVAIDLGNGHELTIRAERKSPDEMYIQSVSINGKTYEKTWFGHAMIANGGSIVFKMGAQPNMKFGSATGAAPPSMSE